MTDRQQIEKATPEQLREALAAYAHEAWGGWMDYLFSKCLACPEDPGALIIPTWAVERWKRQVATLYADLPAAEKESDRNEADKMLAIMDSHEPKTTNPAGPPADTPTK